MTHPLTDEVCDLITDELSIFSVEDCMRSAADWQLEQVMAWMTEQRHPTAHKLRLMKAMRPQETP